MIELTQKKLREAKFFLQMLNKTSQQVVRYDPEKFEFVLSAFLSSARAVTFALQYEDKERYDAWFPRWLEKRSEEDQQCLNFMRYQRNYVEKRGGAETSVNWEYVPITQVSTDTEGHLAYGFHPAYVEYNWFGPPGTPPPQVSRPVHSFEGSNEQVTSACKRYVRILDELVRDFIEAHSSPQASN